MNRNYILYGFVILATLKMGEAMTMGEIVIFDEPSADRWMYPANATPGSRPQAPTFSALPGSATEDDRFGQFLFGFSTTGKLPDGAIARRMLIVSAHLTITVGQDGLFRHDPSEDSWESYSTPTRIGFDNDPGRPVELHGVGFRNGFTPSTFQENSPFGGSARGQRNAFAMGYDATGNSRDVSRNVTESLEAFPWAVGFASGLAAGAWVPMDTVFNFTVNLNLPGVENYLKSGIAEGRLWFMVSSLHPATQQGGEFASWFTKDDAVHQLFGGIAPSLILKYVVPDLHILRGPTGVVHLSWQEVAGVRYVLQSNPTMHPDSWHPVLQNEPIADREYVHSVNVDGALFFRLVLERNE